jgi:hypothetical protein
MAFDPCQFGDDRQPNSVVVHAEGNCNAHPPVRRIDGKMQVLDVLPHDVNRDITHHNTMRINILFDS